MCTSRLQRHVSAIRPIRGRRGAMTLPMSLLDFVSLRSPFWGRCYAEPSLSTTLHLTLCHYFHNSAMCIFSSSKEFIGLDRNFYEIFLFNIHFTFIFLFIIIYSNWSIYSMIPITLHKLRPRHSSCIFSRNDFLFAYAILWSISVQIHYRRSLSNYNSIYFKWIKWIKRHSESNYFYPPIKIIYWIFINNFDFF